MVVPVLIDTGMFFSALGEFTISNYLRWEIFVFVTFMLIACVTFSHKFSSGRVQEVLFIVSSLLFISELVSYLIFTLIDCGFDFSKVTNVMSFVYAVAMI